MRSKIGSLIIGILAFLVVMTAIVMDILTMGLPGSVAGTPAYLLLLFGSNVHAEEWERGWVLGRTLEMLEFNASDFYPIVGTEQPP